MNAERSVLIKARERIERLSTSKIREIAVLDFCRQRGVWLISDEVYHRLVYDQPLAPSLLDLAEPEDKVIVINSFSKTWAMSGCPPARRPSKIGGGYQAAHLSSAPLRPGEAF